MESCKASCTTAQVRWAEGGKVTMVPVTMNTQVGRVKMARAGLLPGSATMKTQVGRVKMARARLLPGSAVAYLECIS